MAKSNSTQQLLILHTRLLNGDRIAPEELVRLLLNPLSRELGRKFPHTDEHLVCDGVTDALLEYCAKPSNFDASRGIPLDRFLAQAAWRNLANIVRGETRRKGREKRAVFDLPCDEFVELDPAAGNFLQEEEIRRQQQAAELLEKVKDSVDKRVLELQLKGERRTKEFARVMNISHLSVEKQRREVKRAKDRIDKLLKRSRKVGQ
jgi:RNA polymerase sigma-70 factor (ECF subfamily)